jgi:homogentisate 1,2-dioxygenase
VQFTAKCNYGLSGSPFTAPRSTNERSWLYRILPGVKDQSPYQKVDCGMIRTAPNREESALPIGPLRWMPIALPDRGWQIAGGGAAGSFALLCRIWCDRDRVGRSLRHFSPVGAIQFDHPDPSIFTVMPSPSGEAGTANIDFVIFSERWMVAENTFRPPWYHCNTMSEFMALIYGIYDAKPEGGMLGGMSLHHMMLPHGPDAPVFEKASNEPMMPHKRTGTMAFMLEIRLPQRLTAFASTLCAIDAACWAGLKRRFDPSSKAPGW